MRVLRFGASTAPENQAEKTGRKVLEGYINEFHEKPIQWKGDQFIATVSDARNPKETHVIKGVASKDPISDTVVLEKGNPFTVDGDIYKGINSLLKVGLDTRQIGVLQQQITDATTMEEIYQQAETGLPVLLNKLPSTRINKALISRPDGLYRFFKSLTPEDALITSDSCGNVDGTSNSPVHHVMTGPVPGAFNVHPIPVTFTDGTSRLKLAQFDADKVETVGTLPLRLQKEMPYLQDVTKGVVPLHSYSLAVMQSEGLKPQILDNIDVVPGMSKRSLFVPGTDAAQIKTSLPALITVRTREIHWAEAQNAITNSKLVMQLADKGKLPNNVWILPDFYAGRVKGDVRTTFIVRGGLKDAVSNNGGGVPSNLTPITACALWSRNTLKNGRTLLEDFVEAGFDAKQLYKDITDSLIKTQLEFIKLGYVPEAHSQNMVYLFDMEKKKFAGILLRDCEGSFIDTNKMKSIGIHDYNGINDDNQHAGAKLPTDPEERRKQISRYYAYNIHQLHIEPLAQLMARKYPEKLSVDFLTRVPKEAVKEWTRNNPDYPIQKDVYLDRFYYKNMLANSLSIKDKSFRVLKEHPFIPKRFKAQEKTEA